MRNGKPKTTEGEGSLPDFQDSRLNPASQTHFRKKGKNWTRLHGMRSSPDASLFEKVPVRYRPNGASGGWSYGRDLVSAVKREAPALTSSH